MEKFLKKIESIPSEGVFFKEEQVEMNNFPATTEWGVVNVFDDIKYQEVLLLETSKKRLRKSEDYSIQESLAVLCTSLYFENHKRLSTMLDLCFM